MYAQMTHFGGYRMRIHNIDETNIVYENNNIYLSQLSENVNFPVGFGMVALFAKNAGHKNSKTTKKKFSMVDILVP